MSSLPIVILSIFMFASGFLLLGEISLEWRYFRIAQPIHILLSLFFVVAFLAPFIWTHLQKYAIIKRVKSPSGWVLLAVILMLVISGIYLFLVGNRGGDLFGEMAFLVHKYGSFLLLPLLFVHARGIALLLFSLIFVEQVPLQAAMTNLKSDASFYHSQDWTNSTKCKSCHSEIFKQWSNSNHKHIAGSNPYYMVLETLSGEDMGAEFRTWCMGCHNPSALTNGKIKSAHEMDGNFVRADTFESDAKLFEKDFEQKGNFRLEEGVSCVACHAIKKADAKGNASFSLALKGREKYAFEDSSVSALSFFGEKFINANPQIHKQSYSSKLYKQSSYCASCHNESHPLNGIKIVSTYDEWKNSPFGDKRDKRRYKTCIDCHMTNLSESGFSPLQGRSTDGGMIKKDIKVHHFAGANHFLASLKSKEAGKQSVFMLKRAAKLSSWIQDGKLFVRVTNSGAGHHLPTGAADFRELWLKIKVKDAGGKVVFTSGELDKNGEITAGSRIFQKVFGDENSKPVGLYFWRYKKLLSDTRIPSGKSRIEVFELPKDSREPFSSEVSLMFRIYPQWVSLAVQKVYPQLPLPDAVEIAVDKSQR